MSVQIGPAIYTVRDSTNDGALIRGILDLDEYGLREHKALSGWAIDVGAHIGAVAVALALRHPELQVVAVEPVPENVEVLRDTIRVNGLTERVHVLEAAAGPGKSMKVTYGWSYAPNQPDDYMVGSRYIGNMVAPNESSVTIATPAVSLRAIRERFGIDRVTLLKIDCEGCEWRFLRSPDIGLVDYITGEYHDRSFDAIRALLDATHEVTHVSGNDIGLFRAVRR